MAPSPAGLGPEDLLQEIGLIGDGNLLTVDGGHRHQAQEGVGQPNALGLAQPGRLGGDHFQQQTQAGQGQS